VEIAPPAREGEGGIRRNAACADALLTEPAPGVTTIPDVLDHAAKLYGGLRGVGWRDVVRIHEEKKTIKRMVDGEEREEVKTWKYLELSEPQYMTFADYRLATRVVGRALVALGINKGDVINIYAQTSVNWQLISHGCQLTSTCIATSYETLGPEGLTHSINEPKCRAIFTNAELIKTLLKVLPNTPSLEFVFYDGKASEQDLEQIRAVREGVKLMHIEELQKLGEAQDDSVLEGRRPTPETHACIMYTSGTTGTPKGVLLDHSNLVASVAGVAFLYQHHIPPGSVYLAYLPLAHVLEFIVELCAVFTGATQVFARPKTLTDASVRNCQGDLTAYQPTVLFGVPAVWETIRKGVAGKLNDASWVLKKVVGASMAAKRLGIPGLGWVADNVILSKLRAPTGGRVAWGMNAGAAIHKTTQDFISVAMLPLHSAYGMTETCGMCTILPPELHQYGSAGIPVPSVEVKLLDVPDMGYTSKNDPPQGEVCVRGASLTKGYYKRPDLNEDPSIFTADGWLRTGDVGQWNADGTLSIVDRLKNLIKLQSGEYIALESLEAVYKSCNLINMLCIYASQDASQPLGVIVPHEAHLRSALRGNAALAALATAPMEDLCANKDVAHMVLKACNDLARQNKFKHAETLKDVVLCPDEWTPDTGLVTAAMKIQRGAVVKRFRKEIDAAYQDE